MIGGREYLITDVKGDLIKEFKAGEIILYARNFTEVFWSESFLRRDYYILLHKGRRKKVEAPIWDTCVKTIHVGLPYGMRTRNEIPILYEDALKEYPQEFIDRLFITYGDKKRYLHREWRTKIRKYLDCLFQGIHAPTVTQMEAQKLPYLYVKKYGEPKCKLAMQKLKLDVWTNTCENLLHFADKINMPIEQIEIQVHGSLWHVTEKAFRTYKHVAPLGGCIGALGRKADVKYGCVRKEVIMKDLI